MGAVVEDVLATRLDLLNLSGYVGGIDTATRAVFGLGDALDGAAKKQLSFGIASGAVALGIASVLGKAVSKAGDLQQIEVGFKSVLGSAEAARAKMAELEQFSRFSPFDFQQSAAGAQQLLAMGVAGKDLIPIMTAAGNATAAAGKGNETFSRALLAIGQIKSKGTLQGDELLQLSEAGIPAMQILRDELKLTDAQMKNIGAAAIPADKAIAALVRGFNKKFGGAMAEQANTLTGSLSNLRDAGNKAWSDLGKPLVPWTTGVVKDVTAAIDWYNKLPEPIHAIGTAAGVAGAVGLGALSLGLIGATAYGKLLSFQVLKLQKEQLGGKGAAEKHGAAEQFLAQELGVAEAATLTFLPYLKDLEKAHWAAARAAEAQAAAEGRTGGGGSMNLPGSTKGKRGSVNLPDLGGKKNPGKTAVTTAEEILAAEEEAAAKAAGAAAKKGGLKLPKFGANTAAEAGEVAADAAKLGRGAKMAASAAEIGSHLKGGLPAIVADVAVNAALNAVPDTGSAGVTKHLAQGTLNGAVTGAMLGSFIPGIGNVAGGVIGGTIGGGMAGFEEWQKTQPKKAEAKADTNQAMLDEMKKQTELLAAIKAGGDNSPIGYKQVSQFEQRRALAKSIRV